MRKLLLAITLLIGTFACQGLRAEEVTFTANAPSAVVLAPIHITPYWIVIG